jgi:hypothetical protein
MIISVPQIIAEEPARQKAILGQTAAAAFLLSEVIIRTMPPPIPIIGYK